MDRALLVLCALLLNAAFGGPRAWYATLGLSRIGLLPARALRHFERKLNRDHRAPRDKETRGWLLVAALALASAVAGLLAGWLLQHDMRFFELLLAAVMLPVRPIWDRIAAIRVNLTENNLVQARVALSGSAWKHHALLDEQGVARAAMETTAVDFSEKIVCPMLGYLWFGLPGLFICKSLTMAREVLGGTAEFGRAARQAHEVLHYLPSRLSALLWIFTPLFLPSGNIQQTAKHILPRFIIAAPRPLSLRAVSVVVKVSLGGPSSPYAAPEWTNIGTTRPLPADVRRAQAAFLFLNVFLFVFVGAFF